ncbi:aldehyde dehydrogenase EutE [Desulfobulbus rhabdoformis]|uniref:aldehyde dehydrogenase family protein n=1 Tax=Desulfobulbus rhabdoformis TaxID=34032 RepID=UPI0019623240|nr:aldehyde dehydrogenase family protein [Desulfobulbus rhabdoformis]MBM9615112.1 aldehyde dehydrogenase EutE [Desulfobulbus rhabdoformis]
MAINEQDLAGIIQKVISELNNSSAGGTVVDFDGIHQQVNDAVDCAIKAQKALLALPMSKRDAIIAAMRQTVLDNNEMLSDMAVEETGLGRYDDKLRENILCATKTPGTEDIQPQAKTGDHGLMLLEYAPVGVIGALTPITNPTGTVIHNSISMIASGNAVIFNPHPSAIKTSSTILRLLHKAIVDNGGPAGLISAIAKPTLDSAREIMEHPKVNMLVATGGKPVVKAVLSSGKKAIGAGAGNPPVLVDETAHIRNAAECIVNGASINNNIFCTCEKEVIVVEEVADTLIKFMIETGKAYKLSSDEAAQVTKVMLNEKGKVNTKLVGRNVQVILEKIGLIIGEQYRLAIFEADRDHPLVWTEQMMPVLPIVRVKNIQEGIELGAAVEQGNRHTAIMHSTNVDNLTAFARAVQTTIFVKNGPAYAGIGLGGEGHTAFTIAGPTGEGMTSARTFTRQRRCTLVEGFRII